jgi:hypothetical protein
MPKSPAPVNRTTAYEQLPTWLSRRDVQAFLGVSLSTADGLIHKLPHRFFGKHLRISKVFLAPDLPRTRRGAP